MEIGQRWRMKNSSRVITPSEGKSAVPERLTWLWDFEEFRLPLMDECSISMQVLALSSPGIQAFTEEDAIPVHQREPHGHHERSVQACSPPGRYECHGPRQGLLFAVDYPFVDPMVALPFFESIPLSEENREKICHLNAEKWLKL